MSIFSNLGAQVNEAGAGIGAGQLANADQISVTDIRVNKKGGAVKAYLTIEIAGFGSISDCKIVQDDGKTAWLAMPALMWKGSDAKTNYKPVLKLALPLKSLVESVALTAWSAHQRGCRHESV